MKIRSINSILLVLATIFWMALIFSLSSQPATQSGKLSTGITREFLIAGEKMGLLIPGTSSDAALISRLDDIVRSGGHFMAYLILGVLVYSLLRLVLIDARKPYIFSFIFCAIYAASDEIHQYFVPGRAMQLSDFIVDSCGTIFGIAIITMLYRLLKKDYIIAKK